MAGAKHNNKLKRKRGKKFRYFGEGGTGGAKAQEQASNPFEEHSTARRARKDVESVSLLHNSTFNSGKALSMNIANNTKTPNGSTRE